MFRPFIFGVALETVHRHHHVDTWDLMKTKEEKQAASVSKQTLDINHQSVSRLLKILNQLFRTCQRRNVNMAKIYGLL